MQTYIIKAIILDGSDNRVHVTERVSAYSNKQAEAYFITKNKLWRTEKGGKKYAKGLLSLESFLEEIRLPEETKPTVAESLEMLSPAARGALLRLKSAMAARGEEEKIRA